MLPHLLLEIQQLPSYCGVPSEPTETNRSTQLVDWQFASADPPSSESIERLCPPCDQDIWMTLADKSNSFSITQSASPTSTNRAVYALDSSLKTGPIHGKMKGAQSASK